MEISVPSVLADGVPVLSLGAGVQSTTLALMAVEGLLPRPAVAIFADTGWEPQRVYDHLDRLGHVMASAGIPLIRVSRGNLRDDSIDPDHRYASVPYYTLAAPYDVTEPVEWARCDKHGPDGCADCESCDEYGNAPVEWVTRPATLEERSGMGRRQCTSEYKLAPINQKVRELLGAAAPDYRRVPRGRRIEQWIGFSSDEIGRVSDNHGVLYVTRRYPLIEMGMSRTACEAWLARRGWNKVAKSACVGCPYHGNAQWRALRDTCECGHENADHYDRLGFWPRITTDERRRGVGKCANCDCECFSAPEWDDAVEFDRQIRKGGARGMPLDGTAYLHRSRMALSIAPIDYRTRSERRGDQLALTDMLDPAELGDPDGCSPYGCRSGEAVAA